MRVSFFEIARAEVVNRAKWKQLTDFCGLKTREKDGIRQNGCVFGTPGAGGRHAKYAEPSRSAEVEGQGSGERLKGRETGGFWWDGELSVDWKMFVLFCSRDGRMSLSHLSLVELLLNS